jgi:hypothetical protein
MGPSHEAADYAAAYPAYPVRTPMANSTFLNINGKTFVKNDKYRLALNFLHRNTDLIICHQ